MPAPATSETEIACDESGFTGGNLSFRHTVFAHASVRVSQDSAAEEMARLRRRVAAHGELKASWLLRWCDHDDLVRLLGVDGVLAGAVVHLSDTRLFLLRRLADALLGDGPVDGLDLPGRAPEGRAAATVLHQHGEQTYSAARWQEFLVTAGGALRAPSRWIPATVIDDLVTSLDELASLPAPGELRGVVELLRSRVDRLRTVRRALVDDPRTTPLVEPLLPAVAWAVLRWSPEHPRLRVLHDEQSALTPGRLADLSRRLERRHPGHTAEVVRVDSRDDPRVQIADLVAGIARRAATGLLTGEADQHLLDLVGPLVDPSSIWPATAPHPSCQTPVSP